MLQFGLHPLPDAPACPRRARPRRHESGSTRLRTPALTLGLAAVLALGAGEAAAQGTRVCDNAFSVLPAGTTEEQVRELSGLLRQGAIAESPHVSIYCRYGRADRRNRGFLIHNPQIVVVDDFVPGIEAFHEGVGDLGIYVHSVSGQPGSAGDFQHHSPADYGQGIFTTGNAEDYITGEDSYGIHARHTGVGRAGIDVRNVSVRTTGDFSHGVYAWQQGSYVLVRRGEDGSDEVVSGYVWNEAEGFYQIGGENCPECRSIRARGAVIVNLIETDRERDQRVRPLVATSGDNADALRAQYTRAAARGHIAVTVEGYTLKTGGTLLLEALVSPQDPGTPLEVASPQDPSTYVFDPGRPSVPNPDYDPDDPRSSRFINVLVHRHRVDDAGNRLEAVDLRPYTAVYLPRSNPYYDPDDPDSPRFVSGGSSDIAIWNGRYFVSQGTIQPEDVTACQGISTAGGRRACYENRVAGRSGDNRPNGFEARGIYASHEGHGDIRIRATDNNIQTGGERAQGIYAIHTGRTIVCGAPGSNCQAGGGTTPGGGGVSIVVTGGAIDTQGEQSHGVWAVHRGDSGADEADGSVDPDDVGTGNVAIAVTDADIDTAGADAHGVFGLIQQTCAGTDEEGRCNELVEGTGVGDIAIAVTGGTIDTKGIRRVWNIEKQDFDEERVPAYAVHARHENTGAIAVRMTRVAAATESNKAHGVFADHRGSTGAVSVTVDGGSVATQGDGAHGVYGVHAGSGDVSVGVMNGAALTTKGIGAQGVRADHDGSGALIVNLAGDVTTEGESSEGVLALHRGSGALAIGMTGGTVKTTGFEAHGLYASHTGAAGTVSVTVSGGSVTAEDAASAGVLAHHGASDREGAVTVSVGQGASVTGGLVGIQLSADADADGNVPTRTVTVNGAVRGVSGAGILLPTGGVVNVGATGRVRGASVGIFSNGAHDVDVTVAGTVEGNVVKEGAGDLTATVSGRVEGNVVKEDAGDLTATVSGRVEGDVINRGGGDLIFSSLAGSTVTGNVHDPRSPMSVHGSVGRLLYSDGGNVRVAGTGRITGIEGIAIRAEAGDLVVRMDSGGEINGDVLALAGRLTLDLPAGSAIKGTLHNPVGLEEVRGSIGRIVYDDGGTLTVTETGRLTGVDGVALLSRAGDLELNVAGRVDGDVVARGAGEHTVIMLEDGEMVGTVRFVGGDNRVEVRKGARITSPEGRTRAIANEGGAPAVAVRATGGGAASDALPRNEKDHILKVLVVASEEEAAIDALHRIEGTLYDHRGEPDVELQRGAEGEPQPVGRFGTLATYTDGVHDVGWVPAERKDEFVFQAELAPRARVYEALPSVLLGLNAPTRHEGRMAAARSAGGGWARVEASRGKWQADTSYSQKESKMESTYRHRRHGVQVGLAGALGEDTRVGASLHHRRGTATTVARGGEVTLYGTGAGVSGTWNREETYLDVQAEMTWYEADITSSSRGVLKKDMSGQGHALGVEAGRRLALAGLPELVLTPRAGLTHSQVDAGSFTDAMGARVSVRDARSLLGRVGVQAEARHGGSPRNRVFGSVDLEHEFETTRAAEVSGTRLSSEAETTWLRLGLNGTHASEDGRWTFAGGMHYATTSGGGYELGGGLSLGLHF